MTGQYTEEESLQSCTQEMVLKISRGNQTEIETIQARHKTEVKDLEAIVLGIDYQIGNAKPFLEQVVAIIRLESATHKK